MISKTILHQASLIINLYMCDLLIPVFYLSLPNSWFASVLITVHHSGLVDYHVNRLVGKDIFVGQTLTES